MKKIVTEKCSEIHIDDVDDGLILVKKKESEFGFIYRESGGWKARTSSGNTEFGEELSFMMKWFGANCEFYVLE